MPKIEIDINDFKTKLKQSKISVDLDKIIANYSSKNNCPDRDKLEKILESVKAELDDIGQDIIKIELNDTNRPDLWSLEGIFRHIKTYYNEGKKIEYSFAKHNGKRIVANSNIKSIRPYIAGFIVKNIKVNDEIIKNLVQKQEKLASGFGSKRKTMSIGLYVDKLINYPVSYKAVSKDTKMTPLHNQKEDTLENILNTHSKGLEYKYILEKFEEYPLLIDSKENILSFPPIINSNYSGEVKIGDRDLFVEFTGEVMDTVLLACNIFAIDMIDLGYDIEPIQIIYEYPTKYGNTMITPFAFQKPTITSRAKLKEIFGDFIHDDVIEKSLNKMGISEMVLAEDDIEITPPIYRNDFISEVDICEDILIGYGIDNIKKEINLPFMVGNYTETEKISRKLKNILVGLGYQEMIFNYLGSGENFIYKMNKSYPQLLNKSIKEKKDMSYYLEDETIIKIKNPISKHYEYLRNSGIPCLLFAEQSSQKATYPHNIFEIGKIVKRDLNENLGSKTYTSLSTLISSQDANINTINSHLVNLFYYMNIEDFKVEKETDEYECEKFIKGRVAKITLGGKKIGVMGEIHPQILENFSISYPVCVFEMILEDLIQK